jgi:hypothetical protein
MAARKKCPSLKFYLMFYCFAAKPSTGDVVDRSCSKDKCQFDFIDERLNQLDQEDPELIKEVKKRLNPIPPNGNILYCPH